MGKSDPDNANRHKQQTQVLVPKDTPGVDRGAPADHAGLRRRAAGSRGDAFRQRAGPAENMLLGEGRGFEIAQGRLRPGPHPSLHAPDRRAQRALELACRRVASRTTFGRTLSQHQSVREDIAKIFRRDRAWRACWC